MALCAPCLNCVGISATGQLVIVITAILLTSVSVMQAAWDTWGTPPRVLPPKNPIVHHVETLIQQHYHDIVYGLDISKDVVLLLLTVLFFPTIVFAVVHRTKQPKTSKVRTAASCELHADGACCTPQHTYTDLEVCTGESCAECQMHETGIGAGSADVDRYLHYVPATQGAGNWRLCARKTQESCPLPNAASDNSCSCKYSLDAMHRNDLEMLYITTPVNSSLHPVLRQFLVLQQQSQVTASS